MGMIRQKAEANVTFVPDDEILHLTSRIYQEALRLAARRRTGKAPITTDGALVVIGSLLFLIFMSM